MQVERNLTVDQIKTELAQETRKINGDFYGKDFISILQLTSKEEVEQIFTMADHMKEIVRFEEKNNKEISDPNLTALKSILKNRTVAEIFYQPSTRTFTSFQAAAMWLGCKRIVAIQGMDFSSAVKGESLRDTVRTIKETTAANVLILRHPDDDSSLIASNFTEIPVINAGSGKEEHPTQAILDLYTIKKHMERLDDLEITMTGDLRNGRTIKSLSELLTLTGSNITLNLVAPEVLKMPLDIIEDLAKKGIKIHEGQNGDLDTAIQTSDLIYITRVQSEWFKSQAKDDLRELLGEKFHLISPEKIDLISQELGQAEYQKARKGHVIDRERIERLNPKIGIMHPLPRVGEIAYDVDDLPNALYIGDDEKENSQMRNGLYTRMAILALILGTH